MFAIPFNQCIPDINIGLNDTLKYTCRIRDIGGKGVTERYKLVDDKMVLLVAFLDYVGVDLLKVFDSSARSQQIQKRYGQ